MRASTFEFKNRFWIIGGIFGLCFGAPHVFDRVNAAEALVRLVRPALNPESLDYRYQIQGVFFAGAVLVFIAAGLRTWATAYLKGSVVHDASLHSDRVVAGGPYRHTRNPLYLGTILMTVGFAPMAQRSGAVAMIVLMILFNYRLILREEFELLASQGAGYSRFRDAVPRLLPSLRPCVPAGDAVPAWGQAIAAESWFWLFGCSELVLAITLQTSWFAVAMIVAFSSYAIFVFFMHQSKKGKEGEAEK
jgi:protein-S-isoprenylcysteine O-methyltransferase Ste14